MIEHTPSKHPVLHSEKTLQIIKEIERNPKVTQRDLALKLQVSLGRINFLINSLIDKGIIEANNFKNSKQKLAYMYLLTPQGIKLKFKLIQLFFTWKLEEYARLSKEIEEFKKELPLENKS